MPQDSTTLEHIVETITREVMIALAEQEQIARNLDGDSCTQQCAEGLCVQTGFDRVGQVVSAGAGGVA